MKNRILAVIAAVALTLSASFTTACTGTTVAQDIVNWTPTIVSTATTVGSVVSTLDPANAALIGIAVTGFDAAANLLSQQAQTYLQNPNATALGQLQAQVLSFQQNVNAALLQALKITNPASQQKVITAIQALATGLTAVLGLISSIKGNTLSPAAVTAPVVKVSQVEPLMNRQLQIEEVARHYGESEEKAAAQIGLTEAHLAAIGL